MENLIAIGLGGFIGSVLRYQISLWSKGALGSHFPFGTIIVNVSGCFLIGLIMALAAKNPGFSPLLKNFITIGFLGALTTFSTFSFETITHFEQGDFTVAGLNILLNVSVSIVAVIIGAYVAGWKLFG